jgi:hypothetical protein
LLALGQLHFRRVTEAGLNTLNARVLVQRQLCYLGCLIKQHERVVAHRRALHVHEEKPDDAPHADPLPNP